MRATGLSVRSCARHGLQAIRTAATPQPPSGCGAGARRGSSGRTGRTAPARSGAASSATEAVSGPLLRGVLSYLVDPPARAELAQRHVVGDLAVLAQRALLD